MIPSGTGWLRSPLLVLCALATCWAAVVFATGGFVARIGMLRISSRSPRTALIVALACAAAAFVLSTPGERRRALPAVRNLMQRIGSAAARIWPRLAPVVAGCAAIGTIAIGLG